MNKLIVALCASAFAFGSACALAQTAAQTAKQPAAGAFLDNDMRPLSKMETQDAKAAKAAAKAKWAAMTPDEQAAAKKAARAKKQSELTALDAQACDNCYDAKKAAAEAKASKAMPAPTKAERQQDLNKTIKTQGAGQ